MASSPSSQPTLSVFPLLTAEEFETACHAFLDRVHVAGDTKVEWSSIRLDQRTTGPILSISREVGQVSTLHTSSDEPIPDSETNEVLQGEASEEDPEALIRAPEPSICLQVIYDVLLSPTYQVPVLYFQLRQDSHPGPLGIDVVYQYLVPDQYRKELESVGIMGGISFGYHPDCGTPTFFVHPCHTTDAMRHIAGKRCLTPEAYLIIWLGLVGNRLGLQLPKELFTTEGMEIFQGIM
ncbi:autophagy-related protein Atg10 [Aspergillus sclerotioniger CBS 115572]|uniref:Ubiquitin-like-conjugating enzyme ATG10 n=1 Tax=Aspergillus sclerotioniger CBS 115572 TaxID=1450535 RepID=A0A317VU19_9EURO|nr:autophagy-related protein Atg10 [Aspergillus sclerotioniger CBS 115572]PWY76358.1 autophagy-related protein Atg10 [Aspergillus sclerotioniger CBS 115572]